MSEDVMMWVLGTVITVLSSILGAISYLLFNHLRDCRDFQRQNAEKIESYHRENCIGIAELRVMLGRLSNDIGDREGGMVAQLHRYGGSLAEIKGELKYLTREQGDKHNG